jgi:prolyl oligopeptidase
MRVTDGYILPESIANTQAANPQWLDDGSGFFYNQLTGAIDTPDRYLDSQARFHRLATDVAKDPILMKRGLDAEVTYEKIQGPYIGTTRGSDHAVLVLEDVRPEKRIFVAPVTDVLTGKAHWTKVADFDDEITDVDLLGADL